MIGFSFGHDFGLPAAPSQGGGVNPTLNPLTVSPNSATVGMVYNGSVSGRTAGSSLTLTGAGASGLSVNSGNGAITGTPNSAGAVNVVETLSGAIGSPRTSNGVVAVQAAVDPNAIPQLSRVAVTSAYDSTGNTTVINALRANAKGVHFNISFTAGQARTEGWVTGPITGKGAIIYLSGNLGSANAFVESFVFDEDYDISNTAEWTNGFPNSIPWAPFKADLVTLTNPYIQMGQMIFIPPGPARKIRWRANNNTASNYSIRVSLMQRPAEGIPDDIVLLAGPSLMSPTNSRSATEILNVETSNQFDPIVVMATQSGLYATEVAQAMTQTWGHYPMVPTGVPDVGGNEFSAFRPYSSDPNPTLTVGALASCDANLNGHPQRRNYAGVATYRDYAAASGKPAVNGLANPENGSMPYNNNTLAPYIAANKTDCWNAEYGIPQLDMYSPLMFYRETALQADKIHLDNTVGVPLYQKELFVEAYRHRKGLGFKKPFVVRMIESFEAGTGTGSITPANKASLAACINQWPPVQNAGQTTARNALMARLNAISVSG